MGTKCCGFELAVTCAKQISASSSCGKKRPSKGGPGVACFLAKLSPVWLGKMPLLRFHIIASKNVALFPVSSCLLLVFAMLQKNCRLLFEVMSPISKSPWKASYKGVMDIVDCTLFEIKKRLLQFDKL